MVQKTNIENLINASVLNNPTFREDINESKFYNIPMDVIRNAENNLYNKKIRSIAYFSMEFGLAPSVYNTYESQTNISEVNKKRDFEIFSNMKQMDYYHLVHVHKLVDMPIYSGGLGVLAGDTLKSSADLKLPMIGIGILWNKGYFDQKFCFHFGQIPGEFSWDPATYPGLIKLNNTIDIEIGDNSVNFYLWKYYVPSFDKKHVVPLLLLDSNHPANEPWAKELTGQLYNSTSVWWKIVQRKILGVGGIRALETLGYAIDLYHLNEGHAAFAFLEKAKGMSDADILGLTQKFAYTCHTPVEAGHDRLPISEMQKVFSPEEIEMAKKYGLDENPNLINLTILAMNASCHVNAVAKKHEEVTKIQFPSHEEKIRGITNGIHIPTWVSTTFENLFNEYNHIFVNWKENPEIFSNISKLQSDIVFRTKLWQAHKQNKKELITLLKQWMVKDDVFTIAWARRAAPYKRPSLVLQQTNKLIEIAKKYGPIQILFAGKAHPNDFVGSDNIKEILNIIDSLGKDRDYLKVLFLENYDTYIAKQLISGVDVWLNNPLPPFEASGTSGMKAILNGVLQLSTMDGWVVEAADKEIGEIFGYIPQQGMIGDENDLKMIEDSSSLYNKLEFMVRDYYNVENIQDEEKKHFSPWIDKMMNCIETSGFFNTSRMVTEYNKNIWHQKPIIN